MTSPNWISSLVRGGLAVVALSSCGSGAAECLALPCPLPWALMVAVTSATSSGPVKDAVLHFTGPVSGSVPCSSSCIVPGYGGTYGIEVSAPGFQALTRSIVVDGTRPDCGCPTTVTQHIDVALVASP